ncbi:phage baseplate plug family protein [Methyloversatilis discipulorum]|uniref:phage baseplate plug family protein n=1 Tax=Methyloversatilis discipulorum TaxID=1119528 RepID=UPI0026EDAE45|nr:hypothetical protein [Methyloversatilis discipulorum]
MSLLDFIQLTPRSSIGGIEIQATLEEIHNSTVQITEHPVELGAEITDHAFKKPDEVVLRCAWSNSSPQALLGTVQRLFSGELSGADYVSDVYSQLRELQEARTPFEIVTTTRRYQNMLITALQVTRDQKTGNALVCTATCREVIIVQTKATTLPPRQDQASPEETAEVEDRGTVQAVPATPSPGGAVSPLDMVRQATGNPLATSINPGDFFSVPALPTPQSFGISLGGLDLNMNLAFKGAAGWVMDVANNVGDTLLSGVPLVTGGNLLEQFEHLGIPGGLWVQTKNAPDAVPTFDNLGVESFLFYVAGRA